MKVTVVGDPGSLIQCPVPSFITARWIGTTFKGGIRNEDGSVSIGSDEAVAALGRHAPSAARWYWTELMGEIGGVRFDFPSSSVMCHWGPGA